MYYLRHGGRRRLYLSLLTALVLIVGVAGPGGAQAQGWTPVYNDGCHGEGHRVLVGTITTRATLDDGCDLVAGYVAPDQRYAGEWVWGYSPAAGAVQSASSDDAAYYRPHICDLLPRFPFAPTARWETRTVQPRDYLYSLYGPDYPAYIAASCRLRERDPRYARIGLDRALAPGSRLAEPPDELVMAYTTLVLRRERVTRPMPKGRLTMVLPGDSLGRFAEIFDVSVERLQTVNHMVDPNALLVGQLLLIPPSDQGSSRVSDAAPTASLRELLRVLCRIPIVRRGPVCIVPTF